MTDSAREAARAAVRALLERGFTPEDSTKYLASAVNLGPNAHVTVGGRLSAMQHYSNDYILVHRDLTSKKVLKAFEWQEIFNEIMSE